MRLGSLFTGYGGLDMAVCEFFGARTVWTSDIDLGACKIITHRFPGVPNLGDITATDWSAVEPVDILTGGFPCQDLSHAGKRAGMQSGTRSALWTQMACAVEQLRPRYVIAENVRGLLSGCAHSDLEPCPGCVGDGPHKPVLRGLGRVLGDLASLGYDARWCGLRAADVGAPHGRFRVFVVAYATGTPGSVGHRDDVRPRWGTVRREPAAGRGATPNAERSGRDRWAGQLGQGWRAEPQDGCAVIGNPDSVHREGWQTAGQQGQARPEIGPTPDSDQQGRQGSEPAQRRDVPTRGATTHPARDGRHEGWPEPTGLKRGSDAAERGHAFADPECLSTAGRGVVRDVGSAAEGRSGEARQQRDRDAAHDRSATPADSDGAGQSGLRRVDAQRRDPDGRGGADVAWGPYEPAIRRWERVLGRPAPAPTEASKRGTQRLSPLFVEHMMGLPEGWVTDVPDLSRNAQLKALGNGVVPQQALAALGILTQMESAA